MAELPNLFRVDVAESVASLRPPSKITSGLSQSVNPRFILLSFFQHDSAKQCRRRLQYRHWLRNCRWYSNSVALCHKRTVWGNFHLHFPLPLKKQCVEYWEMWERKIWPKEVSGMTKTQPFKWIDVSFFMINSYKPLVLLDVWMPWTSICCSALAKSAGLVSSQHKMKQLSGWIIQEMRHKHAVSAKLAVLYINN